MELFNPYRTSIDNILNKRTQSSFSKYDAVKNKMVLENLEKAEVGLALQPIDDKVLIKIDHSEMVKLFGSHKYTFSEPILGSHPDFNHLKHNEYLNHYAVSMFIDIKGSTYLSKEYDLLQIRQIKDTILTLAIQVCSFFGGHIQRLQGDGVFVYFVRKDLHFGDAIINSLNASSLICYFMKYILPNVFKTNEIEPLKVRVGIDYGDEEKVIWSYYGLKYCNELTTTSLHTDLAAKLQGKAKPNGIMLGENMVTSIDIHDGLVSLDPNDKFIYDNSYKKFEFNWETYLRTFDFVKLDGNRKLNVEIPEYRLKCEISEGEEKPYFIYHQNLYSIPKGYKIRFTLYKNDMPYTKSSPKEKLEWCIKNTGGQAKKDNALSPDISAHNNNSVCIVDAKYLGHHDLQCKIIKEYSDNINVRYPVFVR